ncbi:ATR-interacting protein [Dissostichus eleginoides]|uniref:ATR-interacting protein n=1 Tax=Dissostichus eleginoides TaxID=100907 RepID=A0AAD9FJF1_DISEL|nr:ATR-interacting protein [Dissostichus eleginoides]
MNCPPTKRLRGQDRVTTMDFDDPFGDDENFTQDDLNEIDILASQAITSAPAPGPGSKAGTKPTELAHGSAGQSRTVGRATTNQSRESTFGFGSSNKGNSGIQSRDPIGNRLQRFGSESKESSSLLEAQHAELKRKLKEVEEEIMLKSGEIRVLRDSLRGAQQEKETQRQNQVLLEAQKQKEHENREKELNKKVQSLQSELQFKEAEMNEMKTKLLSSDKNKTASPLLRNSLKVLAQLHHGTGGSTSSPTANGFITKEMFGAHVPSKMTPVKTQRDADRGSSSSRSGDRQEVSRPDPFLSVRPAHLQHRGGVLLGLLLQQPLSPSSLSLSHLLSMSLPDIHLTSSGLSSGFLLHSAPAASINVGVGVAPRAALSPVQSLAVTGLNMLSQNRPAAAASSGNKRSCPGAVLLLPLLDLHLSRLCQALDSLRSTPAVSSLPAGITAGLGRLEEAGSTGFSVEDTGLAALRLLHLLLAHSDKVVEAVLSKESQSKVPDIKTEPSTASVGLCSQNALLQSLLHLCEAGQSSEGVSQNEELVLNAMKTLNDSNSEDCGLQTVSGGVSVLTSMSDQHTLAQQLSSQHDPCIFLKLFQFIRTRPDNQVVRLLSRLMTQRAESWTNNQHSTCQCDTELVQTVVIVFHRQWLDLRGSTGLAPPPPECPTPLLPCFSESCRPLLHMYDQVIPAVRDTLRRIPELSESEELALEEICRSEGDDTDDMDTEPGP